MDVHPFQIQYDRFWPIPTYLHTNWIRTPRHWICQQMRRHPPLFCAAASWTKPGHWSFEKRPKFGWASASNDQIQQFPEDLCGSLEPLFHRGLNRCWAQVEGPGTIFSGKKMVRVDDLKHWTLQGQINMCFIQVPIRRWNPSKWQVIPQLTTPLTRTSSTVSESCPPATGSRGLAYRSSGKPRTDVA